MLSIRQKAKISIISMAIVCSFALFELYDYTNGFALAAGSFLIGAIYMMGVYEANLEYLKRGDIK